MAGPAAIPASALLLVLSFPPLHLGVPPLVALVPLALRVESLPADAAGRRQAFRDGVLLGALTWGVLLHWIALGLGRFTGWAVPGWLAATAGLALVTGLVAAALHLLRRDARIPLWLALPLAWSSGEWLRANLPGSLAFPWLDLGTSLTGFPEVVGVAELVGSRGVGFLLGLVNGVLAVAVLRWREGRGMRCAAGIAGAAMLAVVVAVGGVWRARTLEMVALPAVAAVQPNVRQEVKLSSGAVEATFGALGRLDPPEGAAVVILPEALLPVPLDTAGDLRRRLAGWAGGTPLLVGGIGRSGPAGAPVNAVFLLGADGSSAAPPYAKRHLVPFVERVPLLPLPWLDLQARFGSYAPGEGWPLFRVGGVALGAFVCYESAFPGVARKLRRAGADLLVNVTNDAWYGGSGWRRTTALRQHPAHLVMRAVETRAGVVRVANTGLSFVLDPAGRPVAAAPLQEAAVMTVRPLTSTVETWFVRLGDVVGTTAFLVTLLLAGRVMLGEALRSRHTGPGRG